MTNGTDRTAAARWGTRLSFLAAGFAIAAWAPLIPTVKAAVGLDAARFGAVLLCLGTGAVVSMPIAGVIVSRSGARGVISRTSLVAALALPALTFAPNGWALAGCLAVFGAALGALDVAMNVNGAEVERLAKRPLMSGFHAVFSIGGLLGALVSTSLVSVGLPIQAVAALSGALVWATSRLAVPRLHDGASEAATAFALPKGLVVALAVLVCITFLVEGAILDWGGLLLVERAILDPRRAGMAFVLFSVGMVGMRLCGDALVLRFGRLAVLIGSGGAATLGLVTVLGAPGLGLTLAGYVLIGGGAACIAPILLSSAGQQRAMPAGPAVAAVTTAGYAGHLMGPALVGFVAQAVNLVFAFGMLALLTLCVPLGAGLLRRRL